MRQVTLHILREVLPVAVWDYRVSEVLPLMATDDTLVVLVRQVVLIISMATAATTTPQHCAGTQIVSVRPDVGHHEITTCWICHCLLLL